MEQDYHLEVQNWRKEYENRISAPDGWLSISGLFWLKEGENYFGSDPSNEVVLPMGTTPPKAGIFKYQGGKITLEVAKGVDLTCNEKTVQTMTVKLNEYGSSDWLVVGEIKMAVIQRGVRFGVRVYDKNNPARKQFASLRWFPIEEAYRINATFIPHEEPTKLSITNVLGDVNEYPCPGYAEFVLNKQPCRLYPLFSENEDQLWFMFRDTTNYNLTYPGGRFLYTDAPTEGKVVLDFNKCYNPPCAYTDFATCPLPPPQNRLNVPIMAGEMKFH